jgi:D-3-phosphoglycerate dehydrogenase
MYAAALPHKVVLLDYDPALFTPVGFEGEMLAAVGASWEAHRCATDAEAVTVARDADVVIVQSMRSLLNRNVISQLQRARCLIRAGAGYDNVDLQAANERGMMVCNTPTYCTDDVADHAVALLLGCVRHLPRLDAAMRRGHYARELARPTRRMTGRTLGIIGLGRIGSTVARRVAGWQFDILPTTPILATNRLPPWGARRVSLDELLSRSDYISLHCLLTEETHHIIDAAALARVKPGLVLVNTSRGPVVDEAALVEALRDGRVWAAGLDVTDPEPVAPDSPLLAMDNVILTPHVAANSPDASEDVYRLVCEISAAVVQGQVPPFVVNPEVLSRA